MNILDKVRQPENCKLELKRSLPPRAKWLKSIIAFANRAGGIPEPYFEEYQELTNVSRQTATIDLSETVKKNVFERIGKAGKGIACQLP